MDDEFALCWNNFQDNIASGFQNLYDRGDLVDVTLACDGKLLHAHKIVLAICSPYFQEIFISNPCKHPIIILKDVTVGVMCELLQFMYQGVVNVKHTELQAFMKIAQLLQIKGLASSTAPSQKSPSQLQATSSANSNQNAANSTPGSSGTNQNHKHSTGNNNENNNLVESKTNAPAPSSSSSTSSPSPMPFSHIKSPPDPNPFQTGPGLKRLPEYSTDALSIYSRKQYRRNTDSSDHDLGAESIDHVNAEDNFLSAIPHISMGEPRFDLNSVKRESNDHTSSSVGIRNTLPPHFGFDYSLYKNNPEYSSDLHLPNDYSKSFGNHMDIPPIAPGERWFHGKLEFMLSQRGKPLLVHDGHTFGIQYVRKDKKYWQCNLSRKFNCKARVTTTETGEIIVTNNEHCHTEIRQHLRKDYQRHKVMMNALINLSTNHLSELRRQQNCNNNNNNFSNINNLSTSSSRADKEYRPFPEITPDAKSAITSEVRTSPIPNVDKIPGNVNTKNTTTNISTSSSGNESSWKDKNDAI